MMVANGTVSKAGIHMMQTVMMVANVIPDVAEWRSGMVQGDSRNCGIASMVVIAACGFRISICSRFTHLQQHPVRNDAAIYDD